MMGLSSPPSRDRETTKRGRRRKQSLLVGGLLMLTSFGFSAQPAAAADKIMWGGDCRFKTVAQDVGFFAQTETYDLNGGCYWLDADVKYAVNGSTRTKWCPGVTTYASYKGYYQCIEHGVPHRESRSRVKNSTGSTRYTSGWWG